MTAFNYLDDLISKLRGGINNGFSIGMSGREARKKRLGLWKQYNPQPPREFRRMQREGKNS